MLVVIATPTMAGLDGFTAGLIDAGAEVVHARSGMAALGIAKARSPALVVVDAGLQDFTSFALVRELARVNAAIATAVISDLTPEEFHERAEGLGVLRRLPPAPGASDARELAGHLRRIL